MPTLLDLLGIEKPDMDGHSWVPLFKGEKQANRDYIINNVNGVASGKHYPMRVVQTKTSALVVTPWSNGKNRLAGIDSMGGLSFRAMADAAQSNPRIKKRVDQYTIGYPMAPGYSHALHGDDEGSAIGQLQNHFGRRRLRRGHWPGRSIRRISAK